MNYYIPGKRCFNGYKLNANENFFFLSKNVFFLLKIILNNYKKINLYPDIKNIILLNAVSKKYNISIKNIFISNGSDESLFFIFLLFKNFKIKLPKISYPFYNIYCKFHKIFKKNIFYKNILKYNFIFFPNPNSPTGELFSYLSIKKIKKKKFLIIDEAYSDFISLKCVKLINNNNNLIVIKTLSKAFSFAGARIGFIFSNKYIINKINYIKNCFNSYTIDMINSYLSIEIIKDNNHLNYNIQKNNYIKLLFNCFFNTKKIFLNGNFIFLNYKYDFYYFFFKKYIYFRFFNVYKKYVRITFCNYYIIKYIFILYFFWS